MPPGGVEEFEAGIVSGAEGDAADDGLGADVDEAEIEPPGDSRRLRAGPPRAGTAPSRAREPGGPPTTHGGTRFIDFLRASWAELQRVQWPDRRQVAQATAVVLGFVSSPACTSASPTGSPRRSSTSSLLRTNHVSLVRRQHLLRAREQGQAEPRAPRVSLNQKRAVRQVVVPTETVSEMKDGQKVQQEKRTMPGYVLVNMEPQRRLVAARQGHARASPASSAPPTSPCR